MSEIMVMEPRRQLADVTRDIRIKTGQFLLDAIEIGRLLHEAKTMVEPGGWMDYVKKELPFSQSWVNNYMRLYKEYGAEQLSIFGNSQATARLSPTQALELLALPAQERDEFMETHDVENMSTRELKQAIQERDEAIQSKKDIEEDLQAAETRADNHAKRADEAEEEVERLRSELSSAEDAGAAASQKVEKLQKQLAKAKEDKKAAEDALTKAKENPEIPESMMEQMRQQVAADAAKKATEDLQKKLDAALAAQSDAAMAKQVAAEKISELEKQLRVSSPNMVRIGAYIEDMQETFNKLLDVLRETKAEDPDMVEKLKANTKTKLLEPMIQAIDEV